MEEKYTESKHQQLKELEKKHQVLLQQKEVYWKQRPRIQWLKEGDNNTKFFHAYASNRRRRNMIQSLKFENNWFTNSAEIREIFVKNFKNLYTSNQNSKFSFGYLNFPTIPKSQ